MKNSSSIWRSSQAENLASALLSIDTPSLMKAFLCDIMTEKEIIEISSRLEVARMLKSGAKYNDIVEATKLSSRTVARISDWMQNGCNGYAVVLDQINDHSHISPVRAV